MDKTVKLIDRQTFYNYSTEQQITCLTSLARSFLPKFGLSDKCMLEAINYRENATFKITTPDGKLYALRISRADYMTFEQILSEIEWMDALRRDGLLTPVCVKGIDKKPVQQSSVSEVPETRNAILQEWMSGVMFSETIDELLSYRHIGELNAHLHNQSRSWTPSSGFVRPIWNDQNLFGVQGVFGHYGALNQLTKDDIKLFDQAAELIRKRLSEFGKCEDRWGLIHADFMPENIFVEDSKMFVIDFDDCGYGWYLYDFACLLAVHYVHKNPNIEKIKCNWLEGYRSVAIMSDDDFNELDTFVLMRLLLMIGWMETRKNTLYAQEMADSFIEATRDFTNRYLSSKALGQ